MASETTKQHSYQKNTTPLLSIKFLATLIALLSLILAYSTTWRTSFAKFLPKSSFPPLTKTANMGTTASTPTSSSSPSSFKIIPRRHNDRGHADHGWLYTFHTFSFASYLDPTHTSFGPLRVINEDRVAPSQGFGTHPHREFLIWSYIINGTLTHKDSLGNLEELKRGDVQFTSAGTGIRHSEYNRSPDSECHFLQIWAKPDMAKMSPKYWTRNYPDSLKENRLCRIMESTKRLDVGDDGGKDGGDGDDVGEPIPLQADVSMSASILSPGKSVHHDIVTDGERLMYVHVVMGGRTQPEKGGAKIKIGDVVLGEGDGAYIKGVQGPGSVSVESVGKKEAEFLLWDMGTEES